MRLILGVVDVAYTGDGGGATTGEVAQLLEDEYHVMRIFAEEYNYRIGGALADAIADQIQDIANGAPVAPDPFKDGLEGIEHMFRNFLATSEIERINPETPTQAAIEGRSKRRKGGKGPRRPSFIDTGLYQASFRAWLADERTPPLPDVPF